MDRIEDYWERGDGLAPPRRAGRRSTTWPSTAGTSSTPAAHRHHGRRPAGRPDRRTTCSPRSSSTTRTGPPGRCCSGPARAPADRTVLGRRGRHERHRRRASRPWWSSWAPTTRSARSSRSSRPGRPRATPPSRPTSGWQPGSAATCGGPARSPRLGAARGKAARRRRPAHHHRDGPVGHHRADRPRHLQEGSGPQSRYFPFYTRPWITDEDFDPKRDPHITGDEARAIDSAIDAYNETMIDSVAAARERRPRLVPVRHGVAPRPARDPALHRQPVGAAGVVDALRAAARAAGAGPGAEHPVLPVRARRPHRRRPVLPRRRAPDDDRLRHPRPGGHQGDGAGRRRASSTATGSTAPARCRSTSSGCCTPTP